MEAYAQDQDLFFRNYAKAHVRVSELGQEANLMSEFEPHRIVDGGYLEESRLKRMIEKARTLYSAEMTNQSEQDFIEAEAEAKQIESGK